MSDKPSFDHATLTSHGLSAGMANTVMDEIERLTAELAASRRECARLEADMNDERFVYSATCTWHGPISSAKHYSNRPTGCPHCPHCGSVLFELENEQQWNDSVEDYEKGGHPGYVAFCKWLREQSKCFRSTKDQHLKEIVEIYRKETGKDVRI